MRSTVLLLVCVLAVSATAKVRYDGYQVIRSRPMTKEALAVLRGLEHNPLVDFWTDPRLGSNVDLMVAPRMASSLRHFLGNHGIENSVMIEDVQALADKSPMVEPGRKTGEARNHDMDWLDYHPTQDMYSYLDYLEATYDDVSTVSIGQSHEGFDMRLIRICRGGGGDCNNGRPDMYIEGGIHAREWISPATVTWIIKELVEGSGAVGGADQELVDNLNWHILPVTNPDGYEYSRTSDRFWRKTRHDIDGNDCVGVDPNRNWDYMWNTGGSSPNSCSEAYMGPEAMSEAELINVDNYIKGLSNLVFFNDVHSYSQYVLIPWGWTLETAPDDDNRVEVFTRGVEATFAVHGEVYDVICVTCAFGLASGGSVDYGLGTAQAKYTMAHELRDTGEHGFLLPPEQIIPTGEEIWAFHASVARDMIAEYVPKKN